MRLILTTLIIAFFYALIGAIISTSNATFGDIFYIFIMAFGYILIPLIVCVFIFNLLLYVYKKTKRQAALIIQILTLLLFFYLILLLISLPGFIRYRGNSSYIDYNSFAAYFKANFFEGIINVTIFSITIPLIYKFLKKRKVKLNN
jgi:hypothetical protein